MPNPEYITTTSLLQTIYKKMKFSTPPVFNVNDRPIRMNGQIIVYSELRPINDIYDNCSHLQTFLYAKHLIAVAGKFH